MSPVVRVVGIAESDLQAVTDRAGAVPTGTRAQLASAGQNLLITLTRSYPPLPGARGRAIRSLQKELVRVLGR